MKKFFLILILVLVAKSQICGNISPEKVLKPHFITVAFKDSITKRADVLFSEKTPFSRAIRTGDKSVDQLLEKFKVIKITLPFEDNGHPYDYQFDQVGLPSRDIFKKLVENSWAQYRGGDDSIRLTLNLEVETSRMKRVFRDDFQKIFPIVKNAYKPLSYLVQLDPAIDEKIAVAEFQKSPFVDSADLAFDIYGYTPCPPGMACTQ